MIMAARIFLNRSIGLYMKFVQKHAPSELCVGLRDIMAVQGHNAVSKGSNNSKSLKATDGTLQRKST